MQRTRLSKIAIGVSEGLILCGFVLFVVDAVGLGMKSRQGDVGRFGDLSVDAGQGMWNGVIVITAGALGTVAGVKHHRKTMWLLTMILSAVGTFTSVACLMVSMIIDSSSFYPTFTGSGANRGVVRERYPYHEAMITLSVFVLILCVCTLVVSAISYGRYTPEHFYEPDDHSDYLENEDESFYEKDRYEDDIVTAASPDRKTTEAHNRFYRDDADTSRISNSTFDRGPDSSYSNRRESREPPESSFTRGPHRGPDSSFDRRSSRDPEASFDRGHPRDGPEIDGRPATRRQQRDRPASRDGEGEGEVDHTPGRRPQGGSVAGSDVPDITPRKADATPRRSETTPLKAESTPRRSESTPKQPEATPKRGSQVEERERGRRSHKPESAREPEPEHRSSVVAPRAGSELKPTDRRQPRESTASRVEDDVFEGDSRPRDKRAARKRQEGSRSSAAMPEARSSTASSSKFNTTAV